MEESAFEGNSVRFNREAAMNDSATPRTVLVETLRIAHSLIGWLHRSFRGSIACAGWYIAVWSRLEVSFLKAACMMHPCCGGWLLRSAHPRPPQLTRHPKINAHVFPSITPRTRTRPRPGEERQAGVPRDSHHPGGDAAQGGERGGGREGRLGSVVGLDVYVHV